MTNEDVVREARRWVGTRYRHGASLRGLACDCLGLILGVRHALAGGVGPAPMPAYAPDWAEANGRELLAEACDREFARLGQSYGAGDVLLFRWRQGRPATHLAIASHEDWIVHAHVRAIVAEVPLSQAWRRRLAAAYRFPEIA